ncbi:O-antigen ligase family protein [Patescibacteria group bacterium]|nr:O-antigen ligase family protein [Patescibacteria group bacterium]
MERKFLFRRTFWDIPLIIFFLSQLLSFVFSIDRHTSFWGYYSRFNGGLLPIICYLLLYWAFVNNMDKKNTLRAIYFTLISSALVAAYGIAEHFGIDANQWVQDVRNRVFSTLGQPNWLAAWLITLLPLTWALVIINNESRVKKQERNKKILSLSSYLLFFILFLCFLYTKSRSGLLGLGVAFVSFWGLLFWLKRSQIKKIMKPFLIFTGLLIIFGLFIQTPWQPKFLQFGQKQNQTNLNQPAGNNGGGTESGEIRKIVWQGALAIWQHHPFLGTGPETFAYSYYWYRPREHNDVSEWDFLYNKAHNEYLNYMATTGTIGIISYLILIGSFIGWTLKKSFSNNENLLLIALLAGFINILVTNFFGFSVVPVSVLFFLFPAMSVVLIKVEKEADKKVKKQPLISFWQWLAFGGILLFALYFLVSTLKYWYADTRFALGEKLNKSGEANKAFPFLQKAVVIRPSEPIYYDELSLSAANLAVSAASQEQATLSGQLVNLAVSSSDHSLKISPYNLNFWKNRTRLFYSLAEIDGKYTQQALESLLMANKLAPTDAKIVYNLALVYAKLNQEETAIKTLEEAIKLKPNYDQARYALALFYEQKGEIDKAKEQLGYILEKISPQHETARQKLEELKNQ